MPKFKSEPPTRPSAETRAKWDLLMRDLEAKLLTMTAERDQLLVASRSLSATNAALRGRVQNLEQMLRLRDERIATLEACGQSLAARAENVEHLYKKER